MAKLVVITPGLKGVSYELGTHWVTIGRAPGNAFQIVEASISGHHCEVQLRGGELVIRDMRSTNGTFVKGAPVSEAIIRIGDKLRLGDVELRLDPSSSPTSPVSTPINDTRKESSGAGKGLANRIPVLMVDDSMAFLEATGDLFESFANQTWEIHRAAAADQALAILQQRRIELVILDIGMPMLDGLQLLGIIHKRHPDVKKVVLTGGATSENRAACLGAGAELFLEKPVAVDGFRFVFNVLNDLVAWQQREGFSGTLRQVGLTDVIQIECLGRKSCILGVRNQHAHGEIFIEAGTIVHAVAGDISGEKAFQRLLGLNNGEFHLRPYQKPSERTMQGAWEYLLMEAARLRDEERTAMSIAETMFLDKASLAAKATSDIETPPEMKDVVVVSTYDGQWHAANPDK